MIRGGGQRAEGDGVEVGEEGKVEKDWVAKGAGG